MKRVLLLNHDFPPAGGSGVQRVMKFCRYLPEFGWQPTVLSSSCDWQALDDSLLREIPADTEVYRLTYPSHHHAGRWAATAISLLRGLLPAHVVQALSQGLQWRAVQLSRKLLVPDYAALWSLKAIVKAMRLSSRARFDAVLTSGPPHSSHMVGYVLRQCRLTPKWVADFRDPWTSYMGMSPRRGLEYRAGRLLEPEVLRVADAVVTVSAGYAKTLQLSPKDGRKLHLVPNGFDPADIPVDFTRAVAKDCLHIHYNGLLYRPRTPAHFFQALVLCLKDLRPLCPVQATFTGLGEFSSLVGEMDLGETVKDIGRQSHAESLRISRGSDVLLLISNDNPGANGVVTGKVFEYLALGVPILAMAPLDGDLARFLQSFPNVTVVGFRDVVAAAGAVAALARAKKAGTLLPSASPPALRRYERRSLAGELAAILDAGPTGGSRR